MATKPKKTAPKKAAPKAAPPAPKWDTVLRPKTLTGK